MARRMHVIMDWKGVSCLPYTNPDILIFLAQLWLQLFFFFFHDLHTRSRNGKVFPACLT